jgi:DNA-binding NarL/FixJ family response regulator
MPTPTPPSELRRLAYAEPPQAECAVVAVAPWMTVARSRLRLLSERERVVLQLLGEGLDNRAIGRRLSISERTTKRHVTQVLAKLDCRSRLQAGLVALLETLLDERLPAIGARMLVDSAS